MEQNHIQLILWAVIIVFSVGAFWFYARKKH